MNTQKILNKYKYNYAKKHYGEIKIIRHTTDKGIVFAPNDIMHIAMILHGDLQSDWTLIDSTNYLVLPVSSNEELETLSSYYGLPQPKDCQVLAALYLLRNNKYKAIKILKKSLIQFKKELKNQGYENIEDIVKNYNYFGLKVIDNIKIKNGKLIMTWLPEDTHEAYLKWKEWNDNLKKDSDVE